MLVYSTLVLSKVVCLYIDTDWLESICQSKGSDVSAALADSILQSWGVRTLTILYPTILPL